MAKNCICTPKKGSGSIFGGKVTDNIFSNTKSWAHAKSGVIWSTFIFYPPFPPICEEGHSFTLVDTHIYIHFKELSCQLELTCLNLILDNLTKPKSHFSDLGYIRVIGAKTFNPYFYTFLNLYRCVQQS